MRHRFFYDEGIMTQFGYYEGIKRQGLFITRVLSETVCLFPGYYDTQFGYYEGIVRDSLFLTGYYETVFVYY